ncbi:autophagy protein 5 isoform X2 [Alnus glutinosa]|uniref:autophagy protein 5 isoform X2 n=1 Tax=Alnus glutinosa TaxID=3517 RepID=UPI002D770C88|nr:autophagy protein 5 isoform X2 [Alnus glutinosa]
MMEARKYVWGGAIPLQIHLHESEVTTLPPPLPALILAPRIGYLPLLVPHIKPHFSSTLPPGVDTVWFDYKGLPLKWYIPTGILFDLLCADPERPWNLTVHFRGYPGNVLIPCEGEDSVKWSFINSLKEAAYIINGNCKSVMNMSQPDQVELWRSVINGNLEAYIRISSKLKLETVGDEYAADLYSSSFKSRQSIGDTDSTGQVKTGNCFTLHDAVKSLLPEYFPYKSLNNEESSREEDKDEQKVPPENLSEHVESCYPSGDAEVKLVRIQGIQPKLEIPFSWVVNNLVNPEHFLHVCVCLKLPQVKIPSDT